MRVRFRTSKRLNRRLGGSPLARAWRLTIKADTRRYAPPRPTESAGYVVVIASTAALGGFLFGFDTAVINGAVNALKAHFRSGSLLSGFTVAIALLGSAIGAWYAGRLADRYGRIQVMVLAATLFAISALGAGLAVNVAMFATFRLVGGLAVGAASVIAPAYIAEIAPARWRGRLGSLQQLAIVIGIFVALLSDTALAGVAGGSARSIGGLAAWRWMFLVAVLPAAAYGLLALQIPESPRYLVRRARVGDARAVLARLLPAAEVDPKIAEITESFHTGPQGRLRDLVAPNRVRLLGIVWVGIGLSIFQQFVGINVIFYYSSTLWQSVGFTEKDSLIITVITSVANIATTFIAIASIDRIGRKPLLLIGSAGMAGTLGTLAVLFFTAPVLEGHPELHGASGIVALVAANLFVVFFGMSWGPVVWVLLGEMFSNSTRAIALAVAAAAQWLANFAVTLTFPPLKDVSVGLPYALYTGFAVLSFIFVAVRVRETRGRELEQM